MKVWVFVEGPSDRLALRALWAGWCEALRPKGIGIEIIPLEGKSRFLRKIGHRAAEKLVHRGDDLVVGLPDLYPVAPYSETRYAHSDVQTLAVLQQKLVKQSLRETFGFSARDADEAMPRFHGSALKHDLEMLLLAASEALREVLHTQDDIVRRWRQPVEDQNLDTPPKRIVEELFRTKHHQRIAYRDTLHAPEVLRRVSGQLRSVLIDANNRSQCPVFKSVLDWIGERTDVPAY